MDSLQLYVDNTSTQVHGNLRGELYKEFKRHLGYQPEDALWRMQSNPHWDGYTTTVCWNRQYCRCAIKRDGVHFPTGLISRAMDFFREKAVAFEVFDIRDKAIADSFREIPYELTDALVVRDDKGNILKNSDGSFVKGKPFFPYPYQSDAIQKAVAQQRGILKMATGSGKTVLASGIIAAIGVAPAIFYVTSTDLLKQAYDEFTQYIRLNNLPLKIGRVGGGYKEIEDITVMTVQTAVRALDGKWKKYDEDDQNDNTDISDIKEKIAELIHSAKLIICDECITGDSIVMTKDGPIRMENLSGKTGKEVQSFNGNSVVWKKMTHFYRKGRRKIVKIVLSNGKSIRCTLDHLIKTNKGWLPAAAISPGDQILCSAGVDAESKYPSTKSPQVGIQNTFSDTKLDQEQKPNGKQFLIQPQQIHRCVNADAEITSNFITEQYTLLSQTKEVENITLTSTGTISAQINGMSDYQQKTSKQFLGLYLETRHCHSRQIEVKTQDYIVTTDYVNQSGLNTNQIDSYFLPQNTGNITTADTEIDQLRLELLATLNCPDSIKSSTKTERKESQNSGLTPLETSDLRGGFATMDAAEAIISNFTPKVSRNQKLNCLEDGLMIDMENAQSTNIEAIKPFTSAKTLEKKSSHQSAVTSQLVCDTNYITVELVEEYGEENVYDITVEDTHCFFANGMLVHNCQHMAAETCQLVADSSINARWRYGLSATPWRDKGDDILIDACFGRQIVDINASWLIKEKFLVKPNIAFIKIDNMKGERLGAYPTVYKQAIVENTYRNTVIAKLAQNLTEQGRCTLILVQQIAHGETLREMIPDSVFLHGSCTKKARESHIDLMKTGKAPVTIASSLPYEELLLVKFEGGIRQMEIGDICHNYSDYIHYNNVEVLCSIDGKTLSWSKITAIHIHPNTHNLVRVRSDKGEETIVTSNHSLVDADLRMVKPQVGATACSPQGFHYPQEGVTNTIDVVQLLKDEDSIEVEIIGMTHSRIRKLKTELKWYKNSSSVSKSSRIAVEKRTKYMGSYYFDALTELFATFKYHKGRFRAPISKASFCKRLPDYFETKVYCRRSRSKYSLPWKLTITNEFATMLGLLAAEGHIAEQRCQTCKSRFDVIFTGRVNTTDGKYDKDKVNIRTIFRDSVQSSLGWSPSSSNDLQIDISGKLSYLFFKKLGSINTRQEKRVPDCIFSATNDMKESFLWGHYLGDGSLLFHKGQISCIKWHTTSRPLYVGIWSLLQMLGHRIRIDITPKAKDGYKDKYTLCSRDSIKHLIPIIKIEGRDYSNSRRIQKSVDVLDRNDSLVYDISVEGCHNFIGGTLLDHNTIFDEGIDVKPLNALILAGGGKSATRALQRIGRVIRQYVYPDGKNKVDAYVYDFLDQQKYLSQHASARRRIYRSEPEFVIEDFEL